MADISHLDITPRATEAERDFVQTNFQAMPKAWVPKELLVVGKEGSHELGFVLRIFDDGEVYQESFMSSLKALRQALWMQVETARLSAEWKAKNGR